MNDLSGLSKANDSFLQNIVPTYNRFVELIEKRYSCRFVYKSCTSQEGLALKNLPAEYIDLLNTNRPVRFNKTVYFPIILDLKLVGAAQAVENKPLSNRSLFELHDVLNLVLRSLIKSTEDFERLREWENQIHNISEEQNVIRLADARKEKESLFFTETFSANRGPHFNVPCLIEGKKRSDTHKLAFEIHERSHRYAFLSWHDLDDSIKENFSRVIELGAVTIFIPEITELSLEHQLSLSKYLTQPSLPDFAQVIGATILNRKELEGKSRMDQNFIKTVSKAYLKMNQPFDQYKAMGIVEFFHQAPASQKNQ